MPILSRIIVYPVKSLDGLSVERCRVLPSGALACDRRFALRDSEGNFINGKRFPAIHGLRLAEFAQVAGLSEAEEILGEMSSEECRVSNAECDAKEIDRPKIETWLQERFGRRVTLVEHDMAGFPDDPETPGPTVVSLATLREVASWYPGMTLEECRGRFRANLEIDGVEPFWEDRLFAAEGQSVRFQIGEVIFEGVNPCQRCVVPTRAATTGEVWPEFAKTFARRRKETLPPWANRGRFDHFYRLSVNTRLSPTSPAGTLHVGDEVRLE